MLVILSEKLIHIAIHTIANPGNFAQVCRFEQYVALFIKTDVFSVQANWKSPTWNAQCIKLLS